MPKANPYPPHGTAWTRPASGSIDITPGADLLTDDAGREITCRGLYVGKKGSVTVIHPDGSSTQFVDLVAGVIHPIAFIRLTAATATDIIGVY